MKTEDLIKMFQTLDVHKRNVDVQFITPDGKILDIDNVSLLSSISAVNYTPKLTFYVYLEEKQQETQRDGRDTQDRDTRDATGTSMLFQKGLNNSECEKLTRL